MIWKIEKIHQWLRLFFIIKFNLNLKSIVVLYSLILTPELFAVKLINGASSSIDKSTKFVITPGNSELIIDGAVLDVNNDDAVIFSSDAPGNQVIEFSGAAVDLSGITIPNGSRGTAIVIKGANSGITVRENFTAINASNAILPGGGNIYIQNISGTIKAINSLMQDITVANPLISMGSSTATLYLTNSGIIKGNIIGGQGGINITLRGADPNNMINGDIIGLDSANNILNIGTIQETSNVSYTTHKNISNFQTINVNQTGAFSSIFNINNVITTNNCINQGTINIGFDADAATEERGGELSSISTINFSSLYNKAAAIITLKGSGKLGGDDISNLSHRLGAVTNLGVIKAGGSVVKINKFINNHSNAIFTIAKDRQLSSATKIISKNQVFIGNIENNLGTITIGDALLKEGDLSSIDSNNPSAVINASGQVIDVLSNGTVGSVSPLGTVTNYGRINLRTTGVVKIKEILNKDSGNIILENTTLNLNSNTINNAGIFTINSGSVSNDVSNPNFINSGEFKLFRLPGGEGGTVMPLGRLVNQNKIIISNRTGLLINGDLENSSVAGNQAIIINSDAKVYSGNIYNHSGTITIENGELSSINNSIFSTLTNDPNAIIDILGNGKLGALEGTIDRRLGTVNNFGIINASGEEVRVGTFTHNHPNAQLNIKNSVVNKSKFLVAGNMYNNLGSINIAEGDNVNTYGDLSSLNSTMLSNLFNGINQNISTFNEGTIGCNTNGYSLGLVNNNGNINLNGGDVKFSEFINNYSTSKLTIMKNNLYIGNINNNLGIIEIKGGNLRSTSGNASALNNGVLQKIVVSGTGTIGEIAALGPVYNQGEISAGGGNITIGNFTNDNSNAILNITSGIIKTRDINNNLGTIIIGSVGSTDQPSLESAVPANLSNLNNAVNQKIHILGRGRVGITNALGIVNNRGTINADGGDINIYRFENNFPNSIFKITKGLVRVGSAINNKLGTINIIGNGIDAADLSSMLGLPMVTLTNGSSQSINIKYNGSLGNSSPLGDITNNGIINVDTSVAFKSNGVFYNNTKALVAINYYPSIGAVSGNTYVNIGSSINNLGAFNITNYGSENNYIVIPLVENNAGATFSINGPVKITGNFNNNQNATANINGDLILNDRNPINRNFNNKGIVNLLNSVTMSGGNYVLTEGGKHKITINGVITSKLTADLISLLNGCVEVEFIGDRSVLFNNQVFNIFEQTTGSSVVLNKEVSIIDNNGLTYFLLENPILNRRQINLVVKRYSYQNLLNNSNLIEENNNNIATSIGAVLDTISNNNSNIIKDELLHALNNIELLNSLPKIKDAVKQLLPEVNYIVRTTFDAPGVVFDAAQSKLDQIAKLEMKDLKPTFSGYSAGMIQSNDRIWIKSLVNSSLQKQRDSFLGYNSNSYGSILGTDARVSNDLWLGVAGSFVGTKVKSKDFPAKITNIISYQTTVYSTYSKYNYFLDTLSGFAFNTYKTRRDIQFGNFYRQASAKFIGFLPSVKLVFGHVKQSGLFRLIPNLSWHYSVLKQRDHVESGAGNVGLKIDRAKLEQMEGGIGFKIAMFHQEKEGLILNPEVHFNFFRDFKARSQETIAEFIAGGGKFSLKGFTPSKDTYNIGANLTVIKNNNLHVTGNYELKMKDRFVGHVGSLLIKYEL